VENGYGLWEADPEDDESSLIADFFVWLKYALCRSGSPRRIPDHHLHYDQVSPKPLSPELRKAVEGVEVSGLLPISKQYPFCVEFLKFLEHT